MSTVVRGMVFGVFDGLHEGHRAFFTQAKERCETLVVVVALDEAAAALKGRPPAHPWGKRVAAIRAYDPALEVVAGDARAGEWQVLAAGRPDCVFLGYDQRALAGELEAQRVPFEFLEPFEPDRYKSSLLQGR